MEKIDIFKGSKPLKEPKLDIFVGSKPLEDEKKLDIFEGSKPLNQPQQQKDDSSWLYDRWVDVSRGVNRGAMKTGASINKGLANLSDKAGWDNGKEFFEENYWRNQSLVDKDNSEIKNQYVAMGGEILGDPLMIMPVGVLKGARTGLKTLGSVATGASIGAGSNVLKDYGDRTLSDSQKLQNALIGAGAGGFANLLFASAKVAKTGNTIANKVRQARGKDTRAYDNIIHKEDYITGALNNTSSTTRQNIQKNITGAGAGSAIGASIGAYNDRDGIEGMALGALIGAGGGYVAPTMLRRGLNKMPLEKLDEGIARGHTNLSYETIPSTNLEGAGQKKLAEVYEKDRDISNILDRKTYESGIVKNIADNLGLRHADIGVKDGMWQGISNPSRQMQIKSRFVKDTQGNKILDEDYQNRLDLASAMIGRIFKQDGVG